MTDVLIRRGDNAKDQTHMGQPPRRLRWQAETGEAQLQAEKPRSAEQPAPEAGQQWASTLLSGVSGNPALLTSSGPPASRALRWSLSVALASPPRPVWLFAGSPGRPVDSALSISFWCCCDTCWHSGPRDGSSSRSWWNSAPTSMAFSTSPSSVRGHYFLICWIQRPSQFSLSLTQPHRGGTFSWDSLLVLSNSGPGRVSFSITLVASALPTYEIWCSHTDISL